MRKYFAIFLAVVFFSIPYVFSQENITITTYYPSPNGVFETMQLFPTNPANAPACNAATEGTMYYDSTTDTVMICNYDNATNPAAGNWEASSSLWALGGTAPDQYIHPKNANWNVRLRPSDLPVALGNEDAGVIVVDTNDSNQLKWWDGDSWVSAGGGAAGCVRLYYSSGDAPDCPAGYNYVRTEPLQMLTYYASDDKGGNSLIVTPPAGITFGANAVGAYPPVASGGSGWYCDLARLYGATSCRTTVQILGNAKLCCAQ